MKRADQYLHDEQYATEIFPFIPPDAPPNDVAFAGSIRVRIPTKIDLITNDYDSIKAPVLEIGNWKLLIDDVLMLQESLAVAAQIMLEKSNEAK